MLNVALEHFLHIHLPWPALVDRKQNDTEGTFESRHFVKLVNRNALNLAHFQFNHDTSGFSGLVSQVANAIQQLVPNQIGNARNKCRSIHIIRNLGDDNLLSPTRQFFHLHAPSHTHNPTTSFHVGLNTCRTGNSSSRRKIRTWQVLHQLIDRDRWIINQGTGRINNLTQIVRRYIGCHANGNTSGPIHQKVG